MNLNELAKFVSENKYDEIKIIGKTVQIEGFFYHLIAIMRRSDEVYLCILSQTQPWEEYVGGIIGEKTHRQSLVEEPRYEKPTISTFYIDSLELQVESISGSSLKMDISGQLLVVQFLEQGWQVPLDGGMDTADWDCLEMSTVRFCNHLKHLPDVSNAQLAANWQHSSRSYLLQKPCKLIVTDQDAGITGQQELDFTVTDPQGVVREEICYINRVSLFDPWENEEKRFADPQYQKRMLEHISPEKLAEIKQDVFQTLAQTCPRGMCYPLVEYECTMEEANLLFYDREYLDGDIQVQGVGDAGQNGASVTMIGWMHKPQKPQGLHGRKLQCCTLQTLVPYGTKEIFAELFLARQRIPEEKTLIHSSRKKQ